MVGTLKRTVTVDPYKGRPAKVPRTITSKLNKLSRQVNAQKPELRQDGYVVQLPAVQTSPLALIDLAQMAALEPDASEFRLHKIRVAFPYVAGDPVWHILYSSKGSNDALNSTWPLYNQAVPFSNDNYYVPPDPSKAIVYKNLNFSGTNKLNTGTTSPQHIVLEQRFSIPKKMTLNRESGGVSPVCTNQIFYIGGNKSGAAARNFYVTLMYTCN